MKRILHWCMAAAMAVTLVAAAAGASIPDDQKEQERISRQVHHELLMMPQLTIFDNLSYKVEDGTVTLMGQVRNPILKDEATAMVKRIEGVEKVDNRIEILPPSFNDDHIRRREARAIFGYEPLFHYSLGVYPSIHIIVKNGNVTLEGAVNSERDKDIAGIRANEVPGVFSVKNQLKVEN